MPDGTHDAKKRDTVLRLPIGELSDWHLMVACTACRADRVLALQDLVARFGPDQTLATLLPRLRCRETACRRPPAVIRLRNRFPQKPGPRLVEIVLKEPPLTPRY